MTSAALLGQRTGNSASPAPAPSDAGTDSPNHAVLRTRVIYKPYAGRAEVDALYADWKAELDARPA